MIYSIPAEELVRTVMTLFQDQPDLLLGFKEFIPETQEVLNHLVPVCEGLAIWPHIDALKKMHGLVILK